MKSVLIIGLSEFSKKLAYQLASVGNSLCLVDYNEKQIEAISSDFPNVVIGDCMNIKVLEDLDASSYDYCVVGIGENLQSSLEITSNLRELGAKYIVAKANHANQAKFLKMAGANEVIYPDEESAMKLATIINASNIIDFFRINDEYGMYKTVVPDSWAGKPLIEVDPRKNYKCNVLAIIKDGKMELPGVDTIFEKNSTLFIFGALPALKKLK